MLGQGVQFRRRVRVIKQSPPCLLIRQSRELGYLTRDYSPVQFGNVASAGVELARILAGRSKRPFEGDSYAEHYQNC